jgi:hypothetical protein
VASERQPKRIVSDRQLDRLYQEIAGGELRGLVTRAGMVDSVLLAIAGEALLGELLVGGWAKIRRATSPVMLRINCC